MGTGKKILIAVDGSSYSLQAHALSQTGHVRSKVVFKVATDGLRFLTWRPKEMKPAQLIFRSVLFQSHSQYPANMICGIYGCEEKSWRNTWNILGEPN